MELFEWIGETEPLPTVETLFSDYSNYHIYVQNLELRGSEIIKDALNSNIKIYKGDAGRKTTKERWFKHMTHGTEAPKTIKIELSNGCVILDYSRFDTRDKVNRDEALDLIKELAEYEYPTTVANIIKSKITKRKIDAEEQIILNGAFRGGAVNIRKPYDSVVIPRELHLDFHQMYSHILMTFEFPHCWYISDDWELGPYNIYQFKNITVQLKKEGYNLLFARKTGIENHEWVKIGGCALTDIDWNLLLANYNVKDVKFFATLVGRDIKPEYRLRGLITTIYDKRKTATNPAIKQFYKLLNEMIPGMLEKSHNPQGWWLTLDGPEPTKRKKTYNDNLVGIYITAYGRKLLYSILNLLPYDKVIGWDTDAVFFNGKHSEIPQGIIDLMGPNMGQIHIDGDYIKTYHLAIKQYIGIDRETGEIFGKLAGVPNGAEVAACLMNNKVPMAKVRMWDKLSKSYVVVEEIVKINKEVIKRLMLEEKIYE